MSHLRLLLLLLFFLSSRAAWAYPVTVIADTVASMIWSDERKLWIQAIAAAEGTEKSAVRWVTLTGQPSRSGSSAAASAKEGQAQLVRVLQHKGREQAMQEGLTDRPYGARTSLGGAGSVHARFTVFGSGEQRDAARYVGYAKQEALLEREVGAFDRREALLKEEQTAQQTLVQKLAGAQTTSDLQAVSAALLASLQRLEIARQRSEQVRDESDWLEQQLSLERERRREADLEWAQRFNEKLKARALSSLHSQNGENH